MKNVFAAYAKRGLCLLLCLLMAVALLSGCAGGDSDKDGGGSKGDDYQKETVTIKFGTHARHDDDPTYIDPVTGECPMEPEDREAYLAAMEAVLDTYNVQIEWVEYTKDVQTDVLRSLLAEDPICDIALCVTDSQGILLGQNVFQELDEYKYIFDDPDYQWMWVDPIMGHNYILQCDIRLTTSPLAFNITMLDAVDALKDADGNTVYPTDLYKQGKWTWSTFREYLQKVDAYWGNKTSKVTGSKIWAFRPTAQTAIRQAIHSNGGAIYTSEGGLVVGQKADLEAMEYLQDLYDSGLMFCKTNSKTYMMDNQVAAAEDFANGQSVFSTLYTWGTGWVGGDLADRGESMGLVPFPIADDADPTDAAYNEFSFVSDTCSVVRGLSKERTELALKAYALYYTTYYKTLGGVESMSTYRQDTAEAAALADGYDIYHEKIGEDIIKMYESMYGAPINDLSSAVSIHNQYCYVAVGSLTKQDKGYAVNIQEELPTLQAAMNTIQGALSSGRLVDIVPPAITAKPIPVPVGSTAADVQALLSQYIKVTDAMDGDIDSSTATVDVSDADLNRIGAYRVAVSAYDSSLNEAKVNVDLYVYNASNKTKPTLTIKSNYRILDLDEDVAAIKWSDFVASAKDADGLDLIEKVKADVSTLNTSMEGEYDVVLTVTDFAGNETSETITLTVLNY